MYWSYREKENKSGKWKLRWQLFFFKEPTAPSIVWLKAQQAPLKQKLAPLPAATNSNTDASTTNSQCDGECTFRFSENNDADEWTPLDKLSSCLGNTNPCTLALSPMHLHHFIFFKYILMLILLYLCRTNFTCRSFSTVCAGYFLHHCPQV